MKALNWMAVLVLVLGLVWTGCGSEATPEENDLQEEAAAENDGPANTMEEAAKEMEQAVKELNDGKDVEVVNFRELKALLPESFAGLSRTEAGGETTGAMGISVSTAEGKYREGDQRVKVNIIDSGGMGAFIMAQAAWSNMTIDRETSDGYERTTKIEGYPGLEKVENDGARAEVSLLVGERFIVTVEGRNVEMKAIKASLADMDLKSLASK